MPSSLNSALAKIETLVAQGGDADAVLRDVVAALHADAGYAWAGIFFVEAGELVLGPEAGVPDEPRRQQLPVRWQGERVAELAIDAAPEEDRMFLERVAELVAAQCLVGWDTGGEDWDP
jgi:putative methionine-R-sulfoxide reductase with GAF domain